MSIPAFIRYLLALLPFFFLKLVSSAQPTNTLINDVVMPAPNVAALGKYGDIPVDLYTGVPNISIPLYTIQEGSLSLPISLSYHASGVKPGERASLVGLGWSLNTGGMVARTVMGIPDERPAGYYYCAQSNLSTSLQDLDLITRGQKDSEPDIFSYNIQGYSGKFFFNKDQGLMVVPRNDLKITAVFSDNEIKGFTIVTPDGTKYYFGDDPDDGLPPKGTEDVTTNIPGGSETERTAWFPVKISSFDNKYAILFEYENEGGTNVDLGSCRYAKNYANPECTSAGVSCSGSEASGIWIESERFGKRLKKITTPTTTVDFTPSASAREDYVDKRLDVLSIKQGTGTTFCMKYEFQYSYWLDNFNYPSGYPASQKKHLRLNGITQKNCDTANPIIGQSWSFEYEGGADNYLPGLFSKAIDHWGFINDKIANNNNTVNAPSTTIVNGGYGDVTFGASDRETDPVKVKLGTLNKINYPTGGYTRFEFEANTYPRYQIVDSSITQLLNLSSPSCSQQQQPCCNGDSPLSSAITLTNPPGEYYFDLTLSSNGTCLGDKIVYVEAYTSSGTYLGTYGFNYQYNGSNQRKNKPLSAFGNNLFFQGSAYKFKVIADGAIGNFKLFHRTYTYDWYNVPVGGLRVKKIVNNPTQNPTSEEIVATYEYTESANPSKSSGILFRMPKYGFQFGGGGLYYSMVLAQSIVPLGDFEGYHIGYQRVTELRPNNGKIIYEFEYETPAPDPGNYPYPPAQARVKSGKNKKTQIYTEASALVKEEVMTPVNDSYLSAPPPLFKAFQIPYYQGQNCPSWPPPPKYYSITNYAPRTSVYRLASKTEMMDGVTTVISFSYHPNYWELVKETSVTIDGKVHKNKYKYPYDLSASSVRTRLLDENRVAIPFESTMEIDNVVVDGSKTDYSLYSSSTGLPTTTNVSTNPVYPWKFHRFEMTWNNGVPTTGSWILKGTVDKYDIPKGKPSQFTQANWPSETYVWASNGLIQSRTYQSHVWQYDYYPGTRLLRSLTEIDGRKIGFTYDNLMRLKKSTKDGASVNGNGDVVDGNVKVEYFYHYRELPPGDQQNWVKTITSFTQTPGSSLTSAETFEYLDGLGRPLQTVKKAWSPITQKDVVTAVAYDQQSRVIKQYTPFETATNTGAFATVPVSQSHTLTQYEASPLNRPVSVTPPGWYATTTAYGANAASEVGYYDGVNFGSYYPTGNLTKTTVTIPQSSSKNIEIITFRDKKGRIVLSRRKEGISNKADTYNFYDGKDRVTRVLPPGVSTGLTEIGLRFEYAYDAADRMTSKRVPDMAPITMKYNTRDLLVLTQDGNLQPSNKWLLTKYDNYGRPISNGIHIGTNPDPNSTTLAYSEQHTATTYGTSGIELGKVKTVQTWIPTIATPVTRTFTYNTITGRVATNNGNNHLNSAAGVDNYTYTFDFAGNVVTEVRNHRPSSSGTNWVLTTNYTYDHGGRKITLWHDINVDGNAIGNKQLAKYTYDSRGRLIDRSLGAVTSGSINSFLQSIDYSYNDLNWLTSINGGSSFGSLSQDAIVTCSTNPGTPNPTEAAYNADPDGNDIFKLNLYYDVPGLTFGSPTGQRNGNISQLVWQTRGRQRQGYTFQYDYLDRLTTSYYADINASGTATTDNKFQENISYLDAKGNILSMTRRGLYKDPSNSTCFTNGVIDLLTYEYYYGTNRLQKIADGTSGSVAKAQGFNPGSASSSATYAYDNNGNMTTDPYKAMSLTYNHLNLPTQMNFGAGKTIDILYDYTGKKLRKTVKPTATTTNYVQDYVDGIEYRTNGTGPLVIEAIYHEEGRIMPVDLTFQYEYSIKDHLGNTRLTFADLNNNKIVDIPGDILQENHYYSFGMNMNYSWLNSPALDNKYQYNGKELNDDFGLNLSDYGARWYDAAVGRWWGVDPLANESPFSAPYCYVVNNPIALIDPDGRKWINPYFEEFMKELRKENFDVNELEKLGNLGNKAQAIINEIKANDRELYDYVENLTVSEESFDESGNSVSRPKTVDVRVYLSPDSNGEDANQIAETNYGFAEQTINYYGNNINLPMATKIDKHKIWGGIESTFKGVVGFNILLYTKGQNAISLANEIGDVMYAMEYNKDRRKEAQEEAVTKKGYWSSGASRYSFAVENAYILRREGNFNGINIYPIILNKNKFYTQHGIVVKK